MANVLGVTHISPNVRKTANCKIWGTNETFVNIARESKN